MKIVIAAWHLQDFNVGLGRYARGFIEMLGRVDRTNQYEILMPQTVPDLPRRENIRYRTITIPVFRRRMWEQIAPNLVGRYDVLHFPYDSCVAWKRGKFVVTIHDVKPLLFSSDRPKRNLNTMIERSVVPDQRVQVDHVVTVSQWSKNDIATHLSFPPERISVVPPGVSEYFRPRAPSEPQVGRKKYVLSVAGADPTKNLETLIDAFSRLPVHLRDQHDLVLAGDLRHRSELRARVRQCNLESHTRFPGVVTEAELIDLYQHATVFVFPSRYEGFGLPVLEAMACGCPVIASNASSLPEVYGNAALAADPLDVKGFAGHLEQVLADPQCREELQRKGLLRASRFSWEHTAGEMVKVYEEVNNT